MQKVKLNTDFNIMERFENLQIYLLSWIATFTSAVTAANIILPLAATFFSILLSISGIYKNFKNKK